MPLDSLHDLYVEELKDLYNAENQLLKALPKMAKAATHEQLKAAFTEHLEVTREQITRLETIFAELEVSPKGKKCKAMEGLLEEGKDVMAEEGEPAVIDAALIASAQRVEHYEMAGYGCVRTFARLLGYTDAEALLQETLDEEGEADKKLTELAESVINIEAEEGDDGEDGSEDQDAEEDENADQIPTDEAEGDEDEEEGEEDEEAPAKSARGVKKAPPAKANGKAGAKGGSKAKR